MTQVFPRGAPPDLSEGGLHVLIVGVGHYPVLAKPPTGFPAELKQIEGKLPAVTASALRLAEWFENDYEGERPLASIRVLANSPDVDELYYEADGQRLLLESPTLDNIRTAARAWQSDCHEDERHAGMFFFVGHGYQEGDTLGLAADFGEDSGDPLRYAVALDSFVERMQLCKAGLQGFFFDCCREHMDVLDAYRDDGRDPGDALLGVMGTRYQPDQPVIFSTLPTRQAFVKRDGQTLFVESFITMLNEAVNAEPKRGRWVFLFSKMLNAIKSLMEDAAEAGAPPQFPNARPNIAEDRIFAYYPGTPEVECEIRCKPGKAIRKAKLRLKNADSGVSKSRDEDRSLTWRPKVPADTYRVSALFEAEDGYEDTEDKLWAWPGNAELELEVDVRE